MVGFEWLAEPWTEVFFSESNELRSSASLNGALVIMMSEV